MFEKQIIYQLWGLTDEDPHMDHDAMLGKLRRLLRAGSARAVICGIGAERAVYERIASLAREYGAQVWLWLPLNSEMDTLADFSPLIDARGDAVFRSKPAGSGFIFRCPQSRANNDVMERWFDGIADSSLFDGIFLDRVRYPSFQYGKSGVLSCFCPECTAAMGERAGSFREACLRADFMPESFDGAHWTLRDADLTQFLQYRCDVITRQVERYARFARQRGLGLGLDLFTPSLSWFAGQDFTALAQLADFVKPMLYMRTNAPAGLPYELRYLCESIGREAYDRFAHFAGAPDTVGYVNAEAGSMARLREEQHLPARIYAGFELNHVDPIAPVYPETLRGDLPCLGSLPLDGLCAAWNLYSAPQENVDALTEYLEG